jgi:Ulp1 family protease
MTLQQFLSTFSFNNSSNNEILLKDKHNTLQKAKYVSCPRQQNGFDCALFRLGTLLHAIEDLPIDDMIFGQEDIMLFRQELYHIFTSGLTSQQEENPLTSLSQEFIISFFPKLFETHRSKKENV